MRKVYYIIALTILCFSCQSNIERKTISKEEVIGNLKSQLEFPSPLLIETPNFDGNVLPSELNNFLTLQLESKKQNQITDDENWFTNNQLSLPTYTVFNEFRNIKGNLPSSIPKKYKDYIITDGFKYDNYHIFFYGVNFGEKRFLIVTNTEDTQIEYFLDFKNFNYAPKALEGDEDFVFQSIQWAIIEDNILYISHAHSTNAKSSYGKNAYISAIDLKSFKVIWTTKPLSCNSTFTLADNSIICGYGFSAESDYLFVLDKRTGARKQTLKLDKGPSYIVQKDNKIFVRTYDIDYVFSIK